MSEGPGMGTGGAGHEPSPNDQPLEPLVPVVRRERQQWSTGAPAPHQSPSGSSSPPTTPAVPSVSSAAEDPPSTEEGSGQRRSGRRLVVIGAVVAAVAVIAGAAVLLIGRSDDGGPAASAIDLDAVMADWPDDLEPRPTPELEAEIGVDSLNLADHCAALTAAAQDLGLSVAGAASSDGCAIDVTDPTSETDEPTRLDLSMALDTTYPLPALLVSPSATAFSCCGYGFADPDLAVARLSDPLLIIRRITTDGAWEELAEIPATVLRLEVDGPLATGDGRPDLLGEDAPLSEAVLTRVVASALPDAPWEAGTPGATVEFEGVECPAIESAGEPAEVIEVQQAWFSDFWTHMGTRSALDVDWATWSIDGGRSSEGPSTELPFLLSYGIGSSTRCVYDLGWHPVADLMDRVSTIRFSDHPG